MTQEDVLPGLAGDAKVGLHLARWWWGCYHNAITC